MSEIVFDTGVVRYTINNSAELSFNPTDSAFVERLFNAFDELDKKQDKHQSDVEKTSDKREIFKLARQRDEEMRRVIDGVFESPVCDSLFGSMNVYALAGGLPVWCNLMLAVMDEIDTAFAREQKLTNPRVSKYLDKYKKYRK